MPPTAISPYCARLLTEHLGPEAFDDAAQPRTPLTARIGYLLQLYVVEATRLEAELATLVRRLAREAEDAATVLAVGGIPDLGTTTDTIRRRAERLEATRAAFREALALAKAAREHTAAR